MNEPIRKARRPLGLAWLTVADVPPLEHIDIAAEAGFDAVGLRLVAARGSTLRHPIVGQPALVRELRARIAATGVRVLDVEALWIGPDFRAADFHAMLETAAELGAANLLTMGGDEDAARQADSYAALCEAAAPHGICVGMELAAYTAVRSLAEALALLRSAGHPENARLVVDPLHFARAGGVPSDLDAVDPALLSYGQLCDARGPRPPLAELRAEALSGRWLPGHGELPLAELVARLPAGAPLALEVPGPELAGLPWRERALRGAEAARQWLQAHAA